MQIFSKLKADSKPVGEAWDEPNEDPRLERPTEGRNFGDKFSGSFGFGKWKFPQFNLFRNMMIILIVVMILLVIFVVIMMKI